MFKTLIAALAFAAVSPAQTAPAPGSVPDASVALFGAYPDDGVTDATPGIQAAIHAARSGRVHLPADVTGSGAAATAVVGEGVVTGFEITAPGNHYCKAPTIAIVVGHGGGHGAGARATAHVDGACRLTSITLEAPGTGYTEPPAVLIVPQLRCYKVSQIQIFTGTVLEGDGEASCIVPDGSNKPVIFSEGAASFRLRGFLLKGDGKTDVGMQFNGAAGPYQTDGSGAGDAAMSTLDGVGVTGFRLRNIELNRTFGFVFLNVYSQSSGGWGLYLRDGYNNATQIISGQYSENAIGGVYIGTDSIELQFSSIAEGNGKYGIYYHGYAMGLHINAAYFEGNGRNREGWDVYGDFLDYDKPAYGVSIRNSLFNSLDATSAVHIENTVEFEFSHNTGMPPLPGDAFTPNAVILGNGVVNPVIEGNTRLDVRAGSDAPVHTGTVNFSENTLLRSGALNSPVWRYGNTGAGCPARAHSCQDGARFPDGGAAWKIPLATSSGAANMTSLTQTWPGMLGGHLLGAGVWVRTDAGTATAWTEIFDQWAVYTGSALNQPLRQTIGPAWRWVANNAATDPASRTGLSGVTFRFYANDGSPARAVYAYAPQGWQDAAGVPGYAVTAGAPVRRRLQLPVPAITNLSAPPNCKGAPNGIAGYDAATDKIWTCSAGIAKPH